MLAVIPIQDLFGLNFNYYHNRDPREERINVPAIAEHYWRYRMHVPIEQLIADREFSEHIKEMVRSTGRL
jgi:4-alpha-glucanotransferase